MKKMMHLILLLLSFLLFNHPTQVSANSGIQDVHEFEELSGDAQYLGKMYRENYSLDMETVGFLEFGWEMLNGLANILFDFIRTLAYMTANIFYYAMEFDVTEIFADQLNGIQATLSSGLFRPLFPLLFGFTGVLLFKRFIKRDVAGTIQELGKVVLLVVLSSIVVSRSADVLSAATNLTKGMGVAIVNGVNSEKKVSSTASYSANVAGVLWQNLVHEPWKAFQFNEAVSNETVHEFLSTLPSSKQREELVREYMEEHPDSTSFNKKSVGLKRISATFLYLIIMIVKCAVYIFIAAIQLVFQAMAVLFMLLAPIILILAMIPGYEMRIVSSWLKKLFETQLSILIITFVLAMLVKFDEVLFSLAPSYGWYIVIILQTILMIGVIAGRKQIFHGFVNMQKAVSTPGYINTRLRRSGNAYVGLGKLNQGRQFLNEKRKVMADRMIHLVEGTNIGRITEWMAEKMNQDKKISRPRTDSNMKETVQRPAIGVRSEKGDADRPVAGTRTGGSDKSSNSFLNRPQESIGKKVAS